MSEVSAPEVALQNDTAVFSQHPILTPLDKLEPAAYNPREADPTRLEFLRLSLTKLGFILPLYATESGHLLSGHQRLLTATNIGCPHVPVVRVPVSDRRVRNVNLIFNRSTNDMAQMDTSENMWDRFSMSAVMDLCNRLPDRDPTDPSFYRCMNTTQMSIADLTRMLDVPYDGPATTMAGKLLNMGVVMPIVVTQSGKIVNGQYRVMAAGEKRGRGNYTSEDYPVVVISDDEGELSQVLLNLISMRYTVEKQYADQLRYGSFRRPANVVWNVTPTYTYIANKARRKLSKADVVNDDEFWHFFRKTCGESVADLGAGQRRQRDHFKARGIHCADWEPYPCDHKHEIEEDHDRSRPSLALARKVTDEFLADVKSGRPYSMVGLPAVLNSVPFHYDRMCVLAMAHAICSFGTQFVGSVRNAEEMKEIQVRQRTFNRVSETGSFSGTMSMFNLEYEPNITLGDLNFAPKVQKFFHPHEIAGMVRVFFEKVEVVPFIGGNYLWFHGQAPKRINPPVLKRALMHQFDLPYPNGERIDRVDAALDAYGTRLGIDFSKVKEAPAQ